MAHVVKSSKHNWWIVKLNKGDLLYRNRNNAVYAGSDVVNGVVRKDGYLLVVDHSNVFVNTREDNTDVVDVHTRPKSSRSKNAVFYFDEVPDGNKWHGYIHKHLDAVIDSNPKYEWRDMEYPFIGDILVWIGQEKPKPKEEEEFMEGFPKPLKYAVVGALALLGIAIS